MAFAAILSGRAWVLYTFSPPLLASAWYYGGAFLLVGGSMIWVVLMILNMRDWKRDNPGRPVPLPMFAITATAMLWAWAASGVLLELGGILLPRAFGWSDLIDAGLARTLFSWTLHAIVYFWLMPAYIAFYTIVPRAAGGRLYSDTMGRLTVILFLIYSLPVRIHHLVIDPEHCNCTKFIYVLLATLRLQLWLWFIGMILMTLSWPWLGLMAEWRCVTNSNYAVTMIDDWSPLVIVSLVGRIVLLASSMLFVGNLAVLHRRPVPER